LISTRAFKAAPFNRTLIYEESGGQAYIFV